MKYNFDELIDRRGTDAIKWDGVKERWGRDDLLPMWVADMDFRTPPFVMDALRKRLEHEVLGYTSVCKEWYSAICAWLQKRHQWEVEAKQLTFVPGIVRGQAYTLMCFTQPNDKIMVMSPVYPPFFNVTLKLNREVVYSSLDLKDGQYEIDFDRFKQDIKGCRALILCNPHNPGGRVWSKEELEQIAEICYDNQVLVISDEIHADLTLPAYKHHPFASVSEKAAQNSITLMAPSKAFNMPGLASSYAVIINEALNKQFQEYMKAGEFSDGHMLAYIGAAAAYQEGEEWLEQMLEYIEGNIEYTADFLRTHIPSIGMIRPQASYLIFLDCRKLNLTQEELVKLFVEKAHLALNDGAAFGKEGVGFMRLNIGCPRAILQQALQQLAEAVKSL